MRYKFIAVILLFLLISCNMTDDTAEESVSQTEYYGGVSVVLPKSMYLQLENLRNVDSTGVSVNFEPLGVYYSQLDSNVVVQLNPDEIQIIYASKWDMSSSKSILYRVLQNEFLFLMKHEVMKDSVKWSEMVLTTLLRSAECYGSDSSLFSLRYLPDSRDQNGGSLDPQICNPNSDIYDSTCTTCMGFDPLPSYGYASSIVASMGMLLYKDYLPSSKVMPKQP